MTRTAVVVFAFLTVLLPTSYFLIPTPALAQQCYTPPGGQPQPSEECKKTQRTFITNAQCACCGDCQLSDFVGLAVEVSRFIFGISGSLALVMIIYGGFRWLTAGGSSEGIEAGKKAMTAAIVGLLIVFGAWLIVNTVLAALTNNFTSATKVVTGEWWKVKK